MKTLGVDPGWANVGLAVVEWGSGPSVELTRSLRLTGLSPDARFEACVAAMNEALDLGVELIVLEDQRAAQIGQFKAGRFTRHTSRVNEIVGLFRGCAASRGVAIREIGPSTWKRLLGVGGRADKKVVKLAVYVLVPGLPSRLSSHAADAVAMALVGHLAAVRRKK